MKVAVEEVILDPLDLYLVVAVLLVFCLFVVAQLIALRVLPRTSALKALMVCCASGGLVLAGLTLLPFGGYIPSLDKGLLPNLIGALAAEFVFMVLCFNYVIGFFNLGETARRIRIARELQDAGGNLSLEALYVRYNAEIILNARLGRLRRSGQVVETAEGYQVTSKVVLWQARLIWLLKRILNVPDDAA